MGTAAIDGEIAPDGTVITAWVEDFNEPVGEGVVSAGSYFLRVFQYGSRGFGSKTITFKIGSLIANETAKWESLAGDELNLTANN